MYNFDPTLNHHQDERGGTDRGNSDPGTGQVTPSTPPPAVGTAPGATSARDQAVGEWWKTIPAAPEDAYKGAYRHFLGREIDPDTLAAYRANPQGLLGLVNGLYDSEEGAAFRAHGGAASTTSPGRGNIPVGPGSGIANQQYYTGFDFNREHNRNKSAKDSFAHWSSQAGGPQDWGTKAGAEAWFRQHVMPGMVADGFEILDVQGDKAFVRTMENPNGTWIDFVVGADGGNPMLGWQDESYGGAGAGAGAAGTGASSSALDNVTQGLGGNALNAALSTPQGSFSMLDYLLQAAATNKLFDPNANLMLGR
jgi:hypothetical protein